LELFFFITNEDPEKRPSAREILKILDEAEVSLLSIYYIICISTKKISTGTADGEVKELNYIWHHR